MKGTLYIVGTPIGNLDDLSPRAKDILGLVSIIACEDTRVTRKLLSKFDIKNSVASLHQHSNDVDIQKLIERLQTGEDIAYVSDAGTPGISDPGGKFVYAAVKAGVIIVPIPGPSAVITALSISGFPADSFTFLGFPPHKKGRQAFFERLNDIGHTVVFYESKHRILKALESMPQDRPAVVARELTKIHETVYRGFPIDVKKEISETSDKGEFTIVIAPKKWTI